MDSANFLQSEQGDERFRALMLAPAVDPSRKVRRVKRAPKPAAPAVDYSALSLHELWKLSPRGKKKHVSPLQDAIPTYADWCRRCGLKGDAAKREVARAAAECAARRSARSLRADWFRFRYELAQNFELG